MPYVLGDGYAAPGSDGGGGGGGGGSGEWRGLQPIRGEVYSCTESALASMDE